MKIRRNSNLIFREYDDFGYLQNRKRRIESIINTTTCVFFRFLTDEYQDFESVLEKIYNFFSIPKNEQDSVAKDFYELLTDLKSSDFIDITECNSFQSEKKQGFYESDSETMQKMGNQIINMPSQFYHADFIITEDCNNRCIHCYNSYLTRKPCYMTREIFDKGLVNAVDSGVVRIGISGGEALIHPEIEYFLQRIKETGVVFRLYSNGQNITEKICKVMETMCLSPASITLYSANAEIHDSITQNKGSWEKTIRGIKMFRDHGIPFQISVPITKNNILDFEEIFDFCEKKLGATAVGPNPFISYTVNHKKTNSDVVPSLDDIRTFASRYSYYAKKQGYSILPPKKEKSPDYRLYNNGFYGSLAFLPDGSIVAGTLMPDLVLGNVTNDNIRNLWKNSPQLNEWRKYTISMLKECDGCPCRDYCEPSIGDNWVANHDLLKCDKHFCDMNKVYYGTLIQIEEKKYNKEV